MPVRRPARLLAALLAAAWAAAAGAVQVPTFRVASYNVENLFDAVVNQHVSYLTGEPADAEWCAQSWRRWTDERYRTKLARIAWVLDRMKADAVALSEVENRGVLDDLCATLQKNHGWTYPHIAHADSTDPRGIDVAVLSRYPFSKTEYLPQRGRRGMMVATVAAPGGDVVVIANHWKSQVGDAESNIAARTIEASKLRDLLVRILTENPNASFVACGDFNEDLDGPSMMGGLQPANDRSTALESLRLPLASFRPFNLIGDIPEKDRGSFFYARRKVWNTFDGLIVSPRMLLPPATPGPAWRAGEPAETETVRYPEMRWGKEGRPNAFHRVRSYESGTDGDVVDDSNYYGEGYSDHFPVLTVLHRGRPAPAPVQPVQRQVREAPGARPVPRAAAPGGGK